MVKQTHDAAKLLEQQVDAYLQIQSTMMRGFGALFENQARLMSAMVGKRSPDELLAETQKAVAANSAIIQNMVSTASGSLGSIMPGMPGQK